MIKAKAVAAAPISRSSKRRTTKRFAYRNAAIRQATYLGITKLVMMTCAEFADDNGIFWHSIRSLARSSGLSVGATHDAVQELLRSGVLKLLRHGGPKIGSNKYQFDLSAIPAHPTVYELNPPNVQFTDVHDANAAKTCSPTEHPVLQTNAKTTQRSPREPMDAPAFTTRTEEVELHLEGSELDLLKTGNGRDFAHDRERTIPAEPSQATTGGPSVREVHETGESQVMTAPVLAEIYRQAYRQVTGVTCPWDAGDDEAAMRTVARLPRDWTPEEYRLCLEHLFESKDGRFQKKASFALSHLHEYINGPLNQYGKPLIDKDLSPSEIFHKRMRELDTLLQDRRRHRGSSEERI